MPDWFERVSSALEGAGVKPWLVRTGHGRLMVSPHGARILACHVTEGPEQGNLFWHHPEIESPDTARRRLDKAGGGLGGDRLWIAPEVAFMWKDLAAARVDPMGTSHLEPAMDPGDYRILEEGPRHIRLAMELSLLDYRIRKRIDLRVERHIEAIDPPTDLPADVRSVSFAIRNDLKCLGGDEGAAAGAWDILQVPRTGTLICPTIRPVAKPRSYYEPFGDRHVLSDNDEVRFLIDARHRIKMGLLPEQTTGRMGFYRQVGDVSTLIVRLFLPQPGLPYIDVPRLSDARLGGDALQAYNDGGSLDFGEMEYHDPAVIVGRDPAARSGMCVTHALVGPDDAIRQAGEHLGVPVRM